MAINQVPQANQTLAATQNPILQNFINIDAQYGIDHIPFNTAGAGWHNMVTFVNQVTPPVPTGSNLVMYNALNAAATAQALFVSNAAGPAVDFTSSVKNATGYTRLPSGILIVWSTIGSGGSLANGLRTYNFPALPVPQFTAVYSMQITPTSTATDAFVAIYFNSVNIGAGTFTVFQAARALGGINQNGFTYVAVGLG